MRFDGATWVLGYAEEKNKVLARTYASAGQALGGAVVVATDTDPELALVSIASSTPGPGCSVPDRGAGHEPSWLLAVWLARVLTRKKARLGTARKPVD